MTTTARELDPGTVIDGRYRIVRRLGRGAAGDVYEADDAQGPRRVALKFHRRASREASREAEALARLRSEHVVRCLGLASHEGAPVLVMERLDGTTLEALRREGGGRVDARALLRVARDVLKGLAAMHAAGMVHRDVKPTNVFLTREEGRDVARLIDLGAATDASPAEGARDAAGSSAYAAPEQLRDPDGALPASDLYALGVVLFRCLTDRFPAEGTYAEALARTLEGRVERRPSRYAPAVPPHLDALVERALQLRPTHRFASASAMADAVTTALAALDAAPAPAPPRRSLARWSLAAVLAAACVALAAWRIAPRRAPRPRSFVTRTIAAPPLREAPAPPPVVSVLPPPAMATTPELHARPHVHRRHARRVCQGARDEGCFDATTRAWRTRSTCGVRDPVTRVITPCLEESTAQPSPHKA